MNYVRLSVLLRPRCSRVYIAGKGRWRSLPLAIWSGCRGLKISCATFLDWRWPATDTAALACRTASVLETKVPAGFS